MGTGRSAFCVGVEEERSNSTRPEVILLMTSKSLVKRYVLVNGRRVRALLDSGATRSFISPEAAKRIGLQTVDGTSLRVQVANGSEGNTKGSALVQVSMGTQEDVTFGARLFVYDLPSHDVKIGRASCRERV